MLLVGYKLVRADDKFSKPFVLHRRRFCLKFDYQYDGRR